MVLNKVLFAITTLCLIFNCATGNLCNICINTATLVLLGAMIYEESK